MGKYLITGRPGTGKSTVTNALAERGYAAYDLEEVPGMVRLEIKASGEPTDWPVGYVDWDYYAWNLQEKPLVDFLALQASADIFVSVSASNQEKFYHLFDKVFALTVDNPDTLRHRLETRNVHEFNQGPENIQRAVDNYTERTELYITQGCTPIDNTLPLSEVVDTLVSAIKQ